MLCYATKVRELQRASEMQRAEEEAAWADEAAAAQQQGQEQAATNGGAAAVHNHPVDGTVAAPADTAW